jgi:phosphoribosylformimino-5-aminoimidazole carboxamide ribonucleotide (ProFAR) isomerase
MAATLATEIQAAGGIVSMDDIQSVALYFLV